MNFLKGMFGKNDRMSEDYDEPFSNIQRPRQIGTELSHDVLNPARVPL